MMAGFLDRYWPMRGRDDVTFTPRIIEAERILLVSAGVAWLVLTSALLIGGVRSAAPDPMPVVQGVRGFAFAFALTLIAHYWRILNLSRNVHAYGWVGLIAAALIATLYGGIRVMEAF
jgi:hypothetical protein